MLNRTKKKRSILKATGCSKEKREISNDDIFDVNKLNNHYIQLHTPSIKKIPIIESVVTNGSFSFKPIIPTEVILAIELITSSSIGHDGVSLKFLNLILPYFMDQIINVFNFSLKSKTFPKLWNTILIRPIAKINTPTEVNHTRPITINCLFTKIFSSICNNQINGFIESNKIVNEYQSGFRSKHSCTTALICVTEDIRKSLSNNKIVIFVSLDIKSAYPSVSHDLLLATLRDSLRSTAGR